MRKHERPLTKHCFAIVQTYCIIPLDSQSQQQYECLEIQKNKTTTTPLGANKK